MIEPIRTLTDDSQPVRLHALDRPRDPQTEIIRLADLLRDVAVTLTMLQTVITRDWYTDPQRAHQRATARIVEANDGMGRAEDALQSLSMALRATGGL
ncbi:MAG: hypothetical protein IT306_14635 [Chloroflexi bacterium]|nr:hypothetical protein [Chloroflexota bacterium]